VAASRASATKTERRPERWVIWRRLDRLAISTRELVASSQWGADVETTIGRLTGARC
jgi:hypothetical protein